MFSQTNDLQQAIDQANGGGAAEADASTDIAGDLSAIQDQLGVPPMPPADGPGVPPMPAPFGTEVTTDTVAEAPAADTLPETAPAAPENASTEAPAENIPVTVESAAPEMSPAQEAPAETSSDIASEPSAEQILSGDSDLAQIRENVLKDLIPLMDKVQSDPESKFEIYKEAMDTLHDKGLVSGAYKEASQITDENKKAESLIELMKAIDTLK